jgi:maltooligosyltrehalose trehalohydrolase
MSWQGSLGAIATSDGTRFRVWAPDRQTVEVVTEGPERASFQLERQPDGTFAGLIPGLGVATRYRYLVDGCGSFPDPASRFQPEGVHGPSEVVDPCSYVWRDRSWSGVPLDEMVVYEMHVGTFSPDGTFEAARRLLPRVAALGVTAIELMPVADFPGRRGWGYDGVALFAPARCYGRPDDLRRLVDEAHRLGLAVLLDVVYNHLGPDGNYLAQFSEDYFSTRHQTPWGPALNLDGPCCEMVRRFLGENALHWLHEYHLDGLRLDATHHLHDESEPNFLAELIARVRASVSGRIVHLIAEDPRNLAVMVKPLDQGGWGLDAVWSDDFHHQLRRYLAGDHEGCFRDFRGCLADLATTINHGWLFQGEYSIYRGYHRGTDPAGLEPKRFVFTIQNHDRIGNRAHGERLNQTIDLARFRAASAMLLILPATPLLFMGQEWAATAPFVFFTDHHEELGRAVKEGRRLEFKDYAAFADPALLGTIPDCQAEATFLACKLDWTEPDREPHAGILRLYRTLLRLRRIEPALRHGRIGSFQASALDADTLLVCRTVEGGPSLWIVVRFRTGGVVELPPTPDLRWKVVLTTEDPEFAATGQPPTVDLGGACPRIEVTTPSAVMLRASDGE